MDVPGSSRRNRMGDSEQDFVHLDDSLMIADTGATVHTRRNTDGMFDMRGEKCIVRYGNGAHSTSTTVGKWAGMIDQDGEKKKVILDGVTVVPGSAYNLFSLTRTLYKGILSSEGEIMILQCKGMTIRFDHRIETANGFLLAAKFEPVHQQYEQANPILNEGTKIMAQKFHSIFGSS